MIRFFGIRIRQLPFHWRILANRERECADCGHGEDLHFYSSVEGHPEGCHRRLYDTRLFGASARCDCKGFLREAA